MDVNGARTHLVLGLEDWRHALVEPVDENACYSPGRDTLGLRPEPFVFPDRMGASRLLPSDRRGAAADRFGNWYWISADRHEIHFQLAEDPTVYRYWPGDDNPCRTAADSGLGFAPSEPPTPTGLELSGLAITTSQYLVVGVLNFPDTGAAADSEDDDPAGADSETSGLAVFDLHGGGPPVLVPWPPALRFRPFDIACLASGGVAILDVADPDVAGPARLWQLDQFLRVIDLGTAAADPATDRLFIPKDAADEPLPPSGVTGASAGTDISQAVLLDTNWAIAIDALADSSVIVLDRDSGAGRFELRRWRCGIPQPFAIRRDDDAPEATDLVCTDQSANAQRIIDDLIGHDLAVLTPPGDSIDETTIYVVDDQGDQAFAFSVANDQAELVPQYHPLRLFSGKAIVSNNTAVHYDLEDRWFPIPARPNPRFASSATVVLAPPQSTPAGRGFDGRLPGTVWHRLVLDGSIPPGTSITIESRAGDDAAVLETQEWLAEPAPYRRGADSEIPFHRYEPDGRGDSEHIGSFELLFQHAVGRFLQLRLTFHGDGRHTPRVWAMRNHYPRFSYLKEYLPDVYQQDTASASFLDRYLSNAEGWFTTFEGRITNIQRLFDADTTDPAFLPWLASWVGGVIEPDWSEHRTRLFVNYAAQMFARRGTARGLTEAIRLATDECVDASIFDGSAGTGNASFGIRIVEHFRTRETAGVALGDPTTLAGPSLRTTGDPWVVADGRSDLSRRWTEFRDLSDHRDDLPIEFPPVTPSTQVAAAEWDRFTSTEVEANYSRVGSDADVVFWRQFLRDRYRRIGAYFETWTLPGTRREPSFDAIGLPAAIPLNGAPLQDWITFVSATLPIRRNAHQFTVLVPIAFSDSDIEREAPLGPVQRVVEANQPAHTAVEVKPYWGAFRVGAARVGYETIVGEGSRYVDMVLGAERLAYGVLPGGQTWRLDDRLVVGRDRIKRAPVGLGTGDTS